MATRAALLLSLLLLAGCMAPGLYRIQSTAQDHVGVAVSTSKLLTVIHPPSVGQLVWVTSRWGEKQLAEVVRVGDHGLVEIEGRDGQPLDLEHGDSGSPAFLVIGQRRW